MVQHAGVHLVVLVCITILHDTRERFPLAQAASSFPTQCHEDHGRCINDTTFQNCSDGKYVPEIRKADLTNTSTEANKTVRLKCLQSNLVASFPVLQFDWIKWNEIPATYPVLDVDKGNYVDILNDHKYKQSSSTQEELQVSFLFIYNVTEDEVGLYTCVVCNEYGRNYSSAFLTVNFSAVTATTKPSTQGTSAILVGSTNNSQFSERAKIVLGCVGGILGLIILVAMFFFTWQRTCLKSRGSPMILWETNLAEQSENNTPDLQNEHPSVNQRDSIIPLFRNRNSSYRSQLSSAASGGTVLTYADDLFEYPLDENWEVERRSVVMKELIGEGAFGYVMKAEAYELPDTPTPCTVAVKMLKENATDAELSDLISEMQTMKDIGTHKNIVNFLGACTVQGPLLLIVEYCPNGNLRDFLRNHRPSLIELADDPGPQLMIKDLLSFAYQIAKGMNYLSSKKCIHRDLAARNVLISEDFVVKIADFGLSRNLGNTDYYRKTTHGRLPVKWLPIEALFDQQYTVKSDVWSFGIILWEIFTLGGTPYPGIPVESLFTLLKDGYRMESPINCLPAVYEIMLECWSENAKNRPSFSQLTTRLDDMLSSETRQDYVEVLAQSVDCLAAADVEDDDDK